jgi:hypothetical protein
MKASATLPAIQPKTAKWHRSLQNLPVRVDSKPATLKCFIHISFLDARHGFSSRFRPPEFFQTETPAHGDTVKPNFPTQAKQLHRQTTDNKNHPNSR